MYVPILKTHELTITFGGLTAVDHVDFAVDAGTVRGLIGPNGSGKSTLINLLTGFYRPDSGTVEIDGQIVTYDKTHTHVQKGIARTFQHTRIFDGLTVEENVMSGCIYQSKAGLMSKILYSGQSRRDYKANLEKAREILHIDTIVHEGIPNRMDITEYRSGDSMLIVTHRYDGISEKHLATALHTHTYYELEVVYEGRGVQIVGTSSFPMCRGRACLRAPSNPHTTHEDPLNPLRSFNLRFSADFIPRDIHAPSYKRRRGVRALGRRRITFADRENETDGVRDPTERRLFPPDGGIAPARGAGGFRAQMRCERERTRRYEPPHFRRPSLYRRKFPKRYKRHAFGA